jgi:hypothetical protein
MNICNPNVWQSVDVSFRRMEMGSHMNNRQVSISKYLFHDEWSKKQV